MNFVYISRNGENEELRYSIRSVVHNFPDAEILLVGGKPRWYSGDFIEIQDQGSKFDNITECYKEICKIKSIETFVLMNDDFFILDKPEEIDYHYDGELEEKISNHTFQYGISKYARVLSEANRKLKRLGIKTPLNYDVHVPIVYKRELLSEVIDLSQAPRSMYCNMFNVGGTKIQDVKIYKDEDFENINKYYISSEDSTFKKVYDQVLKDKYTNKTDYESF